MFRANKIVTVLSILLLILAILFFVAQKQARVLTRDPTVLMDRFYLLKKTDPQAAKKALLVILGQTPDQIPALQELSQIYLQERDMQRALPILERLHQLQPYDLQYTRQLARHYYETGNWEKAASFATVLRQQASLGAQIEGQHLLDGMTSFLPYYKTYAQQEFMPQQLKYEKSILVQILLDLFYKMKQDSPKDAERLIAVLESIASDNTLVHMERGYIALQKADNAQAITSFSLAYNQKPSPELALQLAYLFMNEGNKVEAANYFLLASQSKDAHIQMTALKGYAYASQSAASAAQVKLSTTGAITSPESLLLDQFYALKKHDKLAAWVLIQKIIKQYPTNVLALREGGFLAIEQKASVKAIDYFTRAYDLTYQAELAMQLGYLYDSTTNKSTAYHYFKLATLTTDKELELRAQNSMTNLSGLQTKFLPTPYFSELFFDPFSQSRFGLTVRPLVARLGIETATRFQTRIYGVFRQTDDNKSESLGQVPQIYEDNVRIIGAGVMIKPLEKMPMIAFVEAGGAYDLVNRFRDRWRGDLRGGVMYYNEFGAKPAYFDDLKIGIDYYSTLYGDSTYFSRYHNNVITTLKTHQGIRLAQYQSSMLNLYMSGRTIVDTNRDFFNNIAEIGSGIGFIPSNRFKVQIRFEYINGMYLPCGGIPNPYNKYYTNKNVQLFLYAKM